MLSLENPFILLRKSSDLDTQPWIKSKQWYTRFTWCPLCIRCYVVSLVYLLLHFVLCMPVSLSLTPLPIAFFQWEKKN